MSDMVLLRVSSFGWIVTHNQAIFVVSLPKHIFVDETNSFLNETKKT